MSWNGLSKQTQIGIFGGTFDPPHNGHLALARGAYQQLQLERVLWVLTPDPPHKRDRTITPYPLRLEMLRQTLLNEEGFEISLVDIDRPGPHYALDTVRLLASQYPRAGLVYLMGGDSLRDLPTWYRADEFVKAVEGLCVMRRNSEATDLDNLEKQIPGITSKVRYLDISYQLISASEIRQLIASESDYQDNLPVSVARFIEEHGLYRQADT